MPFFVLPPDETGLDDEAGFGFIDGDEVPIPAAIVDDDDDEDDDDDDEEDDDDEGFCRVSPPPLPDSPEGKTLAGGKSALKRTALISCKTPGSTTKVRSNGKKR